ncbi:malectin domain-containing carbohydrate-binding protein [Luteolibacter soli]|uniref:Malectin domain-containing carbohydrate-binding protein n=1 Tax=Luteolibacter soli TaxID=3135280 RepID=A0ABU9B3Q3_9BACT
MKLKFLSRGSNERADASSSGWRTALKLSVLLVTAALPVAKAQTVGFSPSLLNWPAGNNNNKAKDVTSLQFGPDNRLYFTQLNGTVIACDVTRVAANNYQATNAETILLVKNLPNYDDDGTYNPAPLLANGAVGYRQCTGLVVTGTAANPVIYVSSCDPREGAGSGGTDFNLDTNSGIISRLTKNGSGVWEKVDIVRGLPRSEENHANNGLNISADGNTLYLAQGGNTNAGSPSANFAYAAEYALSAAILSIDLVAINALPVKTDAHGQNYLYDLPTLNDPNPSRAHNPDGSDVNDPFGGNDGLNQAKLVLGGPVQIFHAGFRNPYDILIAKTPGRAGKMYTFDNAANNGWGGYPKNEATPATVTNEYVTGEPGTVNNKDGLYLLTQGGYRGHPNPIRANPAGAGWFHNIEGPGGGFVYAASPTTDWPPVPVSMADPRQGDFKLPGAADGALITNSASTTGVAEYTAPNFGGAMVGNIIATQYSANSVQRVIMNADGTAATGSSILLSGSSYGTPLDVTCPGPGAAPALWGTIFVGHHSSKITILEPTDFGSGGGGVCSGVFSFALDEDNDGYSNADELTNNSEPCSPAVTPPDNDGDFLSDLLDSDDDNDGIVDTQDMFAIDALNGRDVAPPVRRELFNELGIGFFSIGFKGVMMNPGENYAQKMNVDELIAGGTAGLFTDPTVGPGTPHGASNTQINGFDFGVNINEFTGPVLATSRLGGLLFNGTPTAAQSQGIFIGNGDQDNYVQIAVNANNGAGGIEVVYEKNGIILTQTIYAAPGIFSSDVILGFLIDPIAGTVRPGYSLGGGAFTYPGPALTVTGKVLDSIRGTNAMAFGLLATTGNVATPTFNATWDYFDVSPVPNTASAKLTISGAGTLTSSSTNTGGSYKLENTSTGGQKITSVSVDLRTGMMPDVVFDPNHTAGDADGKAFEVDPNDVADLPAPTGSATYAFGAPHNGVDSADGYSMITVNTSGMDFPAGRLLKFSSDIDPLSVKMTPTPVTGPGPFEASSVSGLEIIGATITVTFDDGTVRKSRLAGLPGTSNANKGSMAQLATSQLPTPVISVAGQSSPFTTTTQPTVRIVGPAGSAVELGVFRSALRLVDGAFTVPGYQIDPFETNRVESFGYSDATIGANGYVDVPLTLNYDTTLGGIHMVTAFLTDGSGNRSATSNVLTIEYNPTAAAPTALFRINAGSTTSYTDTAGQVWAPDLSTSTYNTTSGDNAGFANAISGTDDDVLYQTFRYDGSASSPLDFNFTVPNGNYEVRLHFAETWSSITAAGQRVFDVQLEGQTAINNLDVFAEAGANAKLVKTLQTTVTDGLLTLGLRHEVQNPFICGIEVYQLSVAGVDTEPPVAPAILTQSNLLSSSVQLAWSQASDNSGSIAGYRLYRTGQVAALVQTTSLSYVATGLMPATQYTFGVEAFDAAGNVSPRTTLTLTTAADTQNPTTPGQFKGVAGNEAAVLSWQAATDDTQVQEYRISRDGNQIAVVTGLTYTNTGLTNGTTYQFSVVAVDVVGKLSPAATVSVKPRAVGPALYRVDCGLLSGSYTDLDGLVWATDSGYNASSNTTGPTPAITTTIAGTNAQEMYRTYRYKNRQSNTPLKYEFNVPNGEYELRLHFAEVWTGANAAGVRVFNVAVEGAAALTNFDIFAEAGLNTALVKAIPVTVADGKMTIDFTVVTQNPQVSGIEIFPLQDGPPDTTPPAAPANLIVSAKTDASVSLSWNTPADDAVAWVVKRGATTLGIVSTTGFSETGLTPNTAYSYSVEARDAAGNLSTASTLNVTTDPDTTPPPPPQNFVALPGNGLVALSWQAPSTGGPVDHYQILRNSVELTTVTTLNYTDNAVTNGTTYAYQVKAVDAAGNHSTPASATVQPQSLGAALYRINCGPAVGNYTDPTGTVWAQDAYFNSNNATTGTVTTTVTGTTIPEIYKTSRSKNRNSTTPLQYQFPVTNGVYELRLHFSETSQTAVHKRVFDVAVEGSVALDDLDIYSEVGANKALVKALPVVVSDGSLTIDFLVVKDMVDGVLTALQNPQVNAIEIYPVISNDTTAPSVPSNLASSNVTQTGASLSWTASTDNSGGSGLAGYRVYRRIPATETVEQAQLVGTVTSPSFSESSLTPGTAYEYRVVAYDVIGNVSAAAVLPVTTVALDTTPPTVPGSLVATPSLGQVALTWQASTDIGGSGVQSYLVLRDGNQIGTVTSPGYTDTGLIGNVAFVYEVKAKDVAGNTSASATANATTPPDAVAPPAPRYLTAVPGNGSVTLSWLASAANDVSGYQVRRNGVLITTVSSPGYVDSGLNNGQTYTYLVRAVDTSTNTSANVTASATPRVLGAVVARVNAGGGQFTDVLGNVWAEDVGFFNTGSTAPNNTIPISGTDDDSLYQSERFDTSPAGADLEFSTVVPNGKYEVKLYFAETYNQITAAGQRVFDVYAEEQLAIDDLDIFDRVGSNAALTMVLSPVTVTDGNLNIRFDHLGIQNPKVCAVEVTAIASTGLPTFAEWLTSYNLTGQTTADSDHGGLSNLDEYQLQMNPNDPNDDLVFHLTCTKQGAGKLIALPALKPIGNYYVHRSANLSDIANVANRINTITKAQIEGMTPTQRATYTVQDNTGGTRAFYQLFFEPAP